MFDFDPFDMNSDGDVDGIDFLGFDYLMRYVLGSDETGDGRAQSATEESEQTAT